MNKKRIMGALQRVADEHGVTLETVMEEIEKVMDAGMGSEDLMVRRRWESIPHKKDRPTVVELMCYLMEQAQGGNGMK